MKKIRTVLIGLGTVNRGVLDILLNQKQKILSTYGLELIIVGVADSSGVAVDANGFDYQKLIQLKNQRKHVKELKGYLPEVLVENICDYAEASLLIESSPGNLMTGQPGLQVARAALQKGWSVVLANKAPLVFGFDELHQLAKSHGASLAYSATVCGGLPVINMLQRDLKLATLISMKGIFNATSNYILNELENGGSFEEAIKEAQRLGAAEADPSHDVNGHDTANKLFIIMKSFADFAGTIKDIQVEGIQKLTPQKLLEAKETGCKIKLLAIAEKNDNQWELSVKPVLVEANSFLGTCDGWEMGIELKTDLYESISMKNYEADPVGTSAAVVRDVLEMFKG
jgi:homoserine dehydrogenase